MSGGRGRRLAAVRRRGSRCRRACSSARLSAWLSCGAPARKLRRGRRPLRPHPHRGLVAGQRHQRMHRPGRLDVEREARAPDPPRGFRPRGRAPSREISNCAIAVPCGVTNGISKFQRGDGVDRCAVAAASTRSGSEATCSSVCRAIAASVSASNLCVVSSSGACCTNVAAATGCTRSATRRGSAATASSLATTRRRPASPAAWRPTTAAPATASQPRPAAVWRSAPPIADCFAASRSKRRALRRLQRDWPHWAASPRLSRSGWRAVARRFR